jgi:hypothetical protein
MRRNADAHQLFDVDMIDRIKHIHALQDRRMTVAETCSDCERLEKT